MIRSQDFSLLSEGQEDQPQPKPNVDHAQFRRPEPEQTPAASDETITEDEPDTKSDAKKLTEEWFAKERQRAHKNDLSAMQPSPLLSVLPSAYTAAQSQKPAAAQTPAPKSAPKSEPRQKRVVAAVQTPAEAAASAREAPRQPQTAKPARSGKRTVLLVAAVALLLVGVVCADRFWMPAIRYREALREEAAGNYEQATVLLTALGDYKDSAERVEQLPEKKAVTMMNAGEYQQALELLEAEKKDSALIADCLYALGVLAYNDADPETGLAYTAKLRERFPAYDKTAELEQFCNYSLGDQLFAEANEMRPSATRNATYEKARSAFEKAGACADAEERTLECKYRYALGTYEAEWNMKKAVELLTELGDYRDSAALRLEIMYDYVARHFMSGTSPDYYISYKDDTLCAYLEELAANDYEGTRQMLDRLNGVGFSLSLSYGAEGAPMPEVVTDLSQVYLSYEIPDYQLPEPVTAVLQIKIEINTQFGMESSGSCGVLCEGGCPPTTVRLIDVGFLDDEDMEEERSFTIDLFDGYPTTDSSGEPIAGAYHVPSVSFYYNPAFEEGA